MFRRSIIILCLKHCFKELINTGKCGGRLLNRKTRKSDIRPTFLFPSREDTRLKTYSILKAHEILRKELQHFLEFKESELRTYLDLIIGNDQTFVDE